MIVRDLDGLIEKNDEGVVTAEKITIAMYSGP